MEYIYIIKQQKDLYICKVGGTSKTVQERLKQYNSTGIQVDNEFVALYIATVKDYKKIEADFLQEFGELNCKDGRNRELYFYTPNNFGKYKSWLKSHELYIGEIEVEKKETPITQKPKNKNKKTIVEREITRVEILNRAKRAKNDEFYTPLDAIERELNLYPEEYFFDKTVYCNCDDPIGLTVDKQKSGNYTSAFILYFIDNFERLKLKKIIATHYSDGLDIFQAGSKGKIFQYDKDGVKLLEAPKKYNGDFRHELSLKILYDEADIVVTNPPFSLALEFWNIIFNSGKKAIIMSDAKNAMHKKYLDFFKSKNVSIGYNCQRLFINPKGDIVDALALWYTNFSIQKSVNRAIAYSRTKFVKLADIPDNYKLFDDNGVLIVYQNFIPIDYMEKFGVSIGAVQVPISEFGFSRYQDRLYDPVVKGKNKYSVVLIKKTDSIDCQKMQAEFMDEYNKRNPNKKKLTNRHNPYLQNSKN